jgi:PIN domain nuclease of toxin-antitoxin system
MVYLDTHVVAALNRGELDSFSRRAIEAIEREDDLRISPMVIVELEYLREIGRIKVPTLRIVNDLAVSIGLRICDLPFADVALQAIDEDWTRDPFDRIIVAQARLAKATLITRDTAIQKRYDKALG